MEEKTFDIKFEMNKAIIKPNKSLLVHSNYLYAIYASYFPFYFVKIYKSENEELNATLSKQCVKVSNSILQSKPGGFKIHNVLNISPVHAVLTDSYICDFVDLLSKKFFICYYDILKLMYQVTSCVEDLHKEGFEGLYVSPNSVVLDNYMNYRITNLDMNLNDSNIRLLTDRPEFMVFNYAPEYMNGGKYLKSSNVWDLGILFCSALSGSYVNVDYDSKTAFINDQLMEKNCKVSQLIRSMLSFDPESRPTISHILVALRQMYENTIEPCAFSDYESTANEFGKSILNFDSPSGTLHFDAFVPKQNKIKKFTGSIQEAVSMIVSKNGLLQDEVLQAIIKQAWINSKRHIKLYYEVTETMDKWIFNPISVFKLLMALHSYVFRSSKHVLVVFLKDGKTNALEYILQAIHKCYTKVNEPLVACYSLFLMRKLKFHFRNIKLVETNYSVNKLWLFEVWPDLISHRFVSDLTNKFMLTISIFLAFKVLKFNYFTKNFMLFISKEISNQFSLLANILCLISYVNHHVKLSTEEQNKIDEFTGHVVKVIDDTLAIYNISIEDMKKYKNPTLGNFYIDVKLARRLEFFKKRVSVKSSEFSILEFSKKFLNLIVRMPDSHEMKGGNLTERLERKAINVEQATESLKLFSSEIDNKYHVCPFIFRKIPLVELFERFRVREPDTLDESLEEIDPILTNKSLYQKESSNENRDMQLVAAYTDKIDTGTQCDISQEEIQLNEEIEELIEEEMKPDLNGEPIYNMEKIKAMGNLRKSFLGISQIDENFESNEGLGKFLLKAFARSVYEWIIDFEDIKFDLLIASGSTCNVYRGSYKNLPVAIKKLIKPESDNKIKFLKEFKRELSLLVSLPNHLSLLTLIGFCIRDHEVYLVSEFCEGGTLFDLLYKKSIPIKLT